jgi:polyisoprenoid-binding protein YceI
MKTLNLVAALIWFAMTTSAQAAPQLLATQSDISFTTQQMGVPVDGKFRQFDARVTLDPKKPETATISLIVKLGSATLGLPETDAELSKPEWFNTKLFPNAVFESTVVKALGGGKFEVRGKLTIKAISVDITVPVTLTQASGSTTATGGFAIKRLDFKIGDGDWKDTSVVADLVQVKFKLVLTDIGPL